MDALMEDERQKGLTGFNLKYLAMVCMLLDHIEYIFGFTGKVPIVLSRIGRTSAPIFLFCVIEGFTHTHDKKKYILRIYAISILMGAIRFGFYNVLSRFVRGDGFTPQNAMLSSFVILLVVLSGIYLCSQKRFVIGITAIVVPVILPYAVMWLLQMIQGNVNALFFVNLATFTICPLHTAIADGGTATLVAGIAMYLCRKSRTKQVIAFAIVCILFVGLYLNILSGWKSLLLFLCCYIMAREETEIRSFSIGFIRCIYTFYMQYHLWYITSCIKKQGNENG